MGGNGSLPKPNAIRRNAHPEEELSEEKPLIDAPALFKRAKYSTATKRWWDIWAESEQAEAFWPTDWERLQALAPMVEAYNQGELKWLSEIRLNEERLGATVADRQRLRMAKKPADDQEDEDLELPEGVTPINPYRQAFGE